MKREALSYQYCEDCENRKRKRPLMRRDTQIVVRYSNLLNTKAPEADPSKIPKKTMEPSPPICVLFRFCSVWMAVSAAGIAPWSKLMTISSKNTMMLHISTLVREYPRSLTTSMLSMHRLSDPLFSAGSIEWLLFETSNYFSTTGWLFSARAATLFTAS